MNVKKTKPKKWKSCKAWALCDPETGYINPLYISETRVQNGGFGSITEGWKCVRVIIAQAK